MHKYKKLFIWKNIQSELKIILGSLLAISIILVLINQNQYESKEREIRTQSQNLIQVLSAIFKNELSSDNSKKSMLKSIHDDSSTDFLYAIVFNIEGKPLFKTSTTYIPNTKLPPKLLSLRGERILPDLINDRKILEFHAPINNNKLVGYIRLGFISPSFTLNKKQLYFYFLISLPLFALTIMFSYSIKKEKKSLSKINNILKNNTELGDFKKIKNDETGELSNSIQNFNNYIELANNQIKKLESSQFDIQIANKILFYKSDRLKTVLQSFPDGVVVLDEAGVISFANNKLSQLLGINSEDMLDKKPFECFQHPELLTFLSKYEGKVVTGYSNKSIIFVPKKTKDKKIEVRVYPLFSPKDKSTVFGSLVIFNDVTQEILAKESRGEFVAHIAHELKTPLNVLSMYSENLIGEAGKDEEFRVEAINVIHDEVDRLSSLINNLLNITQFEIGNRVINRTRVKLLDLLQDAFDNISHSDQSKSMQFKLELPSTISSVSVDKDLLRIAINNLLTNAIKYNDPEGSVVLAAEETDKQIFIRVKDTGIGISEEDQKHIFDKFYRSDNDEVRERSGHGLGLSLANEIIQLHHGVLSVNSMINEGSEFIIEFIKDDSWIDKVI